VWIDIQRGGGLNGKITKEQTVIDEATKTKLRDANAQLEVWKEKRAALDKKIALLKGKEAREKRRLETHVKIVLGGVFLTQVFPNMSLASRLTIFQFAKDGVNQNPAALAALKDLMDKHPVVAKPPAAATPTPATAVSQT
jgi:hypothetical protein